jgi:uncharacterized protein YecE (DUF72 family)
MGANPAETSTRFFIGTCGYSYPGDPPSGWRGVFYPDLGKRRADELEYYASFFNSVEINSTFYRPPNAATARGWLERTASNFVFAVKAWQKFTHPARLGDGVSGEKWERFDKSDVARFVDGIQPLADAGRLGPLLFQYPASFGCDAANLERLEATLACFGFCQRVVELRHRSWSDNLEKTEAVLTRTQAAWAFIDEPKFSTSIKQDFTARNDISYLRLHGRNHQKWWKHRDAWERYDYFYRAENIRRLAGRLKALAGRSPHAKFYVLFNNHARGQAVANALMLQGALVPEHGVQAPHALIEAFPELRDFVVVRSVDEPDGFDHDLGF